MSKRIAGTKNKEALDHDSHIDGADDQGDSAIKKDSEGDMYGVSDLETEAIRAVFARSGDMVKEFIQREPRMKSIKLPLVSWLYANQNDAGLSGPDHDAKFGFSQTFSTAKEHYDDDTTRGSEDYGTFGVGRDLHAGSGENDGTSVGRMDYKHIVERTLLMPDREGASKMKISW